MSSDKPTLFRPGVGKRGMNELHYAAYCGNHDELVRALDAGLDPNTKDEYRGYTAVHWLADMAATGGPRLQMLRLLAARGADLDLTAEGGQTALDLAHAAGNDTGEQLAAEILALRARK
jgi:ankyrin repeat protein